MQMRYERNSKHKCRGLKHTLSDVWGYQAILWFFRSHKTLATSDAESNACFHWVRLSGYNSFIHQTGPGTRPSAEKGLSRQKWGQDDRLVCVMQFLRHRHGLNGLQNQYQAKESFACFLIFKTVQNSRVVWFRFWMPAATLVHSSGSRQRGD